MNTSLPVETRNPERNQTMSTRLTLRLAVAFCSTALVGGLQAAVWDGAADAATGDGTDWNLAANWNPAGVPGIGVEADLRMSGANYTINYDTPMVAASVGRVQIDNEEGYTTTLHINAAGFVSTTSNTNLGLGEHGAIVVGSGGGASFVSTWGTTSRHTLYGDLTVTGGSLELSAHNIDAGAGAKITLNSGSLNIAVPDSSNRVIGIGPATIDIHGGVAELGAFLRLGRYASSNQTMYNHGHGTLNMTAGTLHLHRTQLGWNNTYGTMNISGGEVKSAGLLQVGDNNYLTGGATLNLSGGIWEQTNGSLVSVAKTRGGAALNVTGTGVFKTTGDTILGEGGTTYTPNGILLVDGGAFVATNQTGNATLTVRKGTLNLQSGSLTVDRLVANHWDVDPLVARSHVTFAGGTMTINQSATIDNGAVFTVGDGTKEALLVLNGGANSFAGGMQVSNNATLGGAGAITAGAVTVAGGGGLAPGASIGTLTLAETLTLSGETNLEWEISSLGSHDLLAVGTLVLPSGPSTFNLNLSLLDPARTENGVIELFAFNTLAGGEFSDITWNITTLGSLWQGVPTVEINGGAIYLAQVNFIPEPTSLILVGLGALALLRRRR